MAVGGGDQEGEWSREWIGIGCELPSPCLLHHGAVGGVAVGILQDSENQFLQIKNKIKKKKKKGRKRKREYLDLN